jgi:hypothetical protein
MRSTFRNEAGEHFGSQAIGSAGTGGFWVSTGTNVGYYGTELAPVADTVAFTPETVGQLILPVLDISVSAAALRARTMLLLFAGIVTTGCLVRGAISVWQGRLGFGLLLLAIALLLSFLFKEKIAILYIALIFLSVSFSLTAVFDRSGVSIVASILLWALTVALARWDNKRRIAHAKFPRSS